jgi:DMSO/TMAO reductase YedYZ molybdopterin-dependent catalytic subunit
MKKPSAWIGALVGALLTAPLIAILFLATQLVGTPFAPFDVFDWVGRLLPGPIITFGIDSIVSIITTLNLGETSSAAKTAEQFLATAGLFVTGILVGAVLFAVLRGRKPTPRYLPGLIAGLAVGVPVLFISTSINESARASMFVSGAWILVAFLAWGWCLSWVYNRLVDAETATTEDASVTRLSRRQFLISVGGATAAITVVGAGLGALLGGREREAPVSIALTGDSSEPWSANNPLPNADAAVQPAAGTRPEFTPLEDHYRIDINTVPPVVEERDWKLSITGLVDNPVELTLDDLRNNYEPMHQFVTLACISNRIGGDLTSTTLWSGVSLQQILAEVGLQDSASHLRITSVDGFDEVVAIDLVNQDERVMLTYAWDGLLLETKHGFPLRIYIPDHYGMKQPKWIESIEAIDAWEEGYWVRRGWDRDAVMKATSVIDTVAVDMMIVEADDTMLIPIGGIAHAGARGISKVEVKVDDGEWVEAQLRDPLSETTWVIWRYDWPFEAGEHTFAVRCAEGDGTPQIEEMASARPSGATGIDTMHVMV